jgi:hypothetical protein
MTASAAFREAFMNAGSKEAFEFSSIDARLMRYDLFWALYDGSAYRSIHNWATKLKTDYGLYKYIRNIYNPSYRLIDFWQTHLMGGSLDPAAGDGKGVPSALPIETDNDALRDAISTLWQASGWQVNKDIYTLRGSLMGDVALKVCDDPERSQVYMSVVHPGTIRDVTLDTQGNVKGYTITETRYDPRPNTTNKVTYTETAERGEGESVIFKTFLNNAPYAWNPEQGEQWEEPYGFIPLVMVQHNNVGLDYGWSELQPGLGKFREVDDQASLLNDQIRKTVNPMWLFSGIGKPDATPTPGETTKTATRPEPGREETIALYAAVGGDAKALVAPIDIANVLTNIKNLQEEIERDYPELQMDIWNAGGDTSGKALRVARQRTEAKVNQRRTNYDDGLKRAQQMAVAIGGFRGYEGYSTFGLESYKAGNLEYLIGKRPVFAVDTLDDLERDAAFWGVADKVKVASGNAGLKVWLKGKGWSDENIKAVVEAPENALVIGGA